MTEAKVKFVKGLKVKDGGESQTDSFTSPEATANVRRTANSCSVLADTIRAVAPSYVQTEVCPLLKVFLLHFHKV